MSYTAGKIRESEQSVLNQSFDTDYNILAQEQLGYDGKNLQRINASNMAMKVTTVGSVTYLGLAAPGTLESEAKWQCKKIDTTSGVVITWADNANFSQVASDLTTLTYV